MKKYLTIVTICCVIALSNFTTDTEVLTAWGRDGELYGMWDVDSNKTVTFKTRHEMLQWAYRKKYRLISAYAHEFGWQKFGKEVFIFER